MSAEHPSFFLNADVVWVGNHPRHHTTASRAEAAYSIGELAAELNISPRALRFYESKGLISPTRSEGVRRYCKIERDRMLLILKAKRFGFTLVEIKEMISTQDGPGPVHVLKLSRTKCSEQISLLERQREEIEEALSELRRIHTMLVERAAGR